MTAARTLFALALVSLLAPAACAQGDPRSVGTPAAERTAFVVRGPVLAAAAAFAASGHPGVLLLDSPANVRFLDAFRPERVADTDADRLTAELFPRTGRVVVAPPAPRRLLLHAAALAVAARAPLVVTADGAELRRRLDRWDARELLLCGPSPAADLDGFQVRHLPDADAVHAAAVELQTARGPVETLVVANPADALSDLAPLALARRRAVLLLTDDRGTDTAAVVRRALAHPALARADNLLILARPETVPTERRDNPIAGRDETIEMEPLTPGGQEPYTFATGRLFHADPGVVALVLARPRLLPPDGTPRAALVASNPGGSLPLLETCSRTSVRELLNRGYDTTALINEQLSPGQLRRRLPACDLFLWEGHHNTLIKDWHFAEWDEPLRPSLMFLQSCLALTEEKATPLLTRGALAVLGSSSRIYSATGGAFSLAYLDAVLYDRRPLGGALRQAKNFLLAYALLKEKRLGAVRLAGANQRSAWAFTLWGDPELRLPAPPAPDAAAAVRCRVRGDTVTLTIPEATPEAAAGSRYQVPYRPNARLAGLIRPGADDGKLLVPFAFAEVALPSGPAGAAPRLRTKLAENAWVFVWDGRRRVGYLLVTPPASGKREYRFHVAWEPADVTGAAAAR